MYASIVYLLTVQLHLLVIQYQRNIKGIGISNYNPTETQTMWKPFGYA